MAVLPATAGKQDIIIRELRALGGKLDRIVELLTPPADITSFQVTSITPTSVVLAWTVEPASRVVVTHRLDGAVTVLGASDVPAGITTRTIDGLVPGTRYIVEAAVPGDVYAVSPIETPQP